MYMMDTNHFNALIKAIGAVDFCQIALMDEGRCGDITRAMYPNMDADDMGMTHAFNIVMQVGIYNLLSIMEVDGGRVGEVTRKHLPFSYGKS